MLMERLKCADRSAGALRLVDGPIDLVARAWGEAHRIESCLTAAIEGLDGVLDLLAAELSSLRRLVEEAHDLQGPVAQRMVTACRPYSGQQVTPMAAVAGSVADHVLERMVKGKNIEKALVNNGGDIAVHLSPGMRVRAGMIANIADPSIGGLVELEHGSGVGGMATSGWRGRSFSLGIADSVTVLAANAAAADVAATLLANAVDVDDPAIERKPAVSLDPDSDLGDRLVTVNVGAMHTLARDRALDAGTALAQSYQSQGLILAACLVLGNQSRIVGPSDLLFPTSRPRSRRPVPGEQAVTSSEPPSSA